MYVIYKPSGQKVDKKMNQQLLSQSDDELQEKNLSPHNTGIQLAIDIFQELDSKNLKIEQSDKEVGFRKNDLLISATSLTLNQKRLLDVLFFIAAQNLENNAQHFKAVKKHKNGIFEVDLSFFKWLLSLPKTRNSSLKNLMSSVSQAKLQAIEFFNEDEIKRQEGQKDALKRWQTHNFFGSAYLDVPNNIISFSINPVFNDYLHNPKNFHFLSLRYVFPSLASKILYDWLMLNDDLSIPITVSIDQLKKELGQEKKKSYQRFAEFNRSFLTPGITVINETTNLEVELNLNRNSQAQVTHVEFVITELEKEKTQDQMYRIHQYDELRDVFGLLPKNFDEILQNQDVMTDSKIEDAKAYVRYRLKQGADIKSVPAYFMHCLREGYHIGLYDAERLDYSHPEGGSEASLYEGKGSSKKTLKTAKTSIPNNPYLDKKLSKEGWTLFHSLNSEEKSDLVKLFSRDISIKSFAIGLKIDTSPAYIEANFASIDELSCAFGVFVTFNL